MFGDEIASEMVEHGLVWFGWKGSGTGEIDVSGLGSELRSGGSLGITRNYGMTKTIVKTIVMIMMTMMTMMMSMMMMTTTTMA